MTQGPRARRIQESLVSAWTMQHQIIHPQIISGNLFHHALLLQNPHPGDNNLHPTDDLSRRAAAVVPQEAVTPSLKSQFNETDQ
jgi:hypothetical protein